jgi:hypothetical protein
VQAFDDWLHVLYLDSELTAARRLRKRYAL